MLTTSNTFNKRLSRRTVDYIQNLIRKQTTLQMIFTYQQI